MSTPTSTSSAQSLQVSVDEEPGRVVYRLAGDLDSDSASHLRSALAGRSSSETDTVLDLAALRFIDSSGLGVLVGALKRSEANGHSLILRAPTPSLRRVLTMTGLDRAFPIER